MEVYGINMYENIIPLNWYNHVSIFLLVLLLLKFFTSRDELFEEIEQIKGANQKILPKEELDMLCFTELNTRINRDYLNSSSYYHQYGYLKIYGTAGKMGDVNKKNNPIRTVHKCKKVTFPKEVVIAYE